MRHPILIGLWGSLWLALPFGSASLEPPPELTAALEEMAALEARIEALVEDQSTRRRDLFQTQRDYSRAREFLRAGEDLRRQGQRVLRNLEGEAARTVAVIEEAKAAGQSQLQAARSGLTLSGPLVYFLARRHGAVDARTVTLALVHRHRRREAELAVEHLLRLEALQGTRLQDRDRLAGLAERYAAFNRMGIEDLRARHQELARRLEVLQTEAAGSDEDLLRLRRRRGALNELVARLTTGAPVDAARLERELAALPAVPPAPTVARAGSVEPAAAARRAQPILPEVPYDETPTELRLATREGEASPAVRLEVTPKLAETAGAESHRRFFWRARRAEVAAPLSGRVLFSGPFAGYRHLLVIDHGGQWVTLYGNLSDCELTEGEAVDRGRPLGHYQAETAGRAEPFWIEARHEGVIVAIDRLPALEANWAERLFLP